MQQTRDWSGTEDKTAALAARFQDGEFTETVYRASLYALGWRGDDIDHIVNRQMEITRGKKSARIPRGRY